MKKFEVLHIVVRGSNRFDVPLLKIRGISWDETMEIVRRVEAPIPDRLRGGWALVNPERFSCPIDPNAQAAMLDRRRQRIRRRRIEEFGVAALASGPLLQLPEEEAGYLADLLEEFLEKFPGEDPKHPSKAAIDAWPPFQDYMQIGDFHEVIGARAVSRCRRE